MYNKEVYKKLQILINNINHENDNENDNKNGNKNNNENDINYINDENYENDEKPKAPLKKQPLGKLWGTLYN